MLSFRDFQDARDFEESVKAFHKQMPSQYSELDAAIIVHALMEGNIDEGWPGLSNFVKGLGGMIKSGSGSMSKDYDAARAELEKRNQGLQKAGVKTGGWRNWWDTMNMMKAQQQDTKANARNDVMEKLKKQYTDAGIPQEQWPQELQQNMKFTPNANAEEKWKEINKKRMDSYANQQFKKANGSMFSMPWSKSMNFSNTQGHTPDRSFNFQQQQVTPQTAPQTAAPPANPKAPKVASQPDYGTLINKLDKRITGLQSMINQMNNQTAGKAAQAGRGRRS